MKCKDANSNRESRGSRGVGRTLLSAESVVDQLRRAGYSLYTGVPCSLLKPLINRAIDHPSLDYIAAASEGEAVGIALGAYFAGRKSVVMCQNSGLGNMVNPLTSLCYPFRVPCLLIVTWRGEPGVEDEPQHEQMGRITHGLLDALEIPWLPFPRSEEDIPAVVQQAEKTMSERQLPFALVMSNNTVAPYPLGPQSRPEVAHTEELDLSGAPLSERLARTEAIETILESLPGNEARIATTGMTGRELFSLGDDANNVYVVGGMGCASAIGLGIAHTRPDQRVLVLDGDGAALMKLGAFATIGRYQPRSFLHVILDNESYDSTGGQATTSPVVRFAGVAASANYRLACAVDRADDLRRCVKLAQERRGPCLVHVKIRPGSPSGIGRPALKPYEVKDRFMSFLARTDRGRGESR